MAATRNEIIESALDLIGVKAANEDAAAEDIQTGANELNRMVNTWQADGLHLFSRDEATLFLQPSQRQYNFGTGSTDHATLSFTQTTLSAAAVATDATVDLTAVGTIAVNDNIGIKLDSGSLHWTTVTSVADPTVGLNDAMPSAAASGNTVYYYTTDIGKPLRIPDSRRQQGTSPNTQEIPMVRLGRRDYEDLPNKNTSGTPVQFYYDRKRVTGEYFVWPVPTSVDTIINMTIWKKLDPFANSGDEGVFPDEWEEALVYNLAIRLAPRYGSAQISPDVAALAMDFYTKLLDWDQGGESIFFEFSYGRGQ